MDKRNACVRNARQLDGTDNGSHGFARFIDGDQQVAARDGVGTGARLAHAGAPTSTRPNALTSVNCIPCLAFSIDLDAY